MVQPAQGSVKQSVTMKTKRTSQVWVVVEVKSGVPVGAETFSEEGSARKREQKLRAEMRENYDEVGLFATRIRR